ncbi:MAG TPA: FmdB family zinc ribbon protein [Actinomycetota bacterium]|nr:FmdB family zinc ribbon protein [Actinomycetota bacterium]
MPTYEYVCKACGHRFEVVRSIHDDPLTSCPDCGGELRKVFTPPAITFKGSGFYATDHGKKRSQAASGKEKDTGKKDGSPSGGGTTSKKDEGSSSSAGSGSSGTGSGSGSKKGGSGS